MTLTNYEIKKNYFKQKKKLTNSKFVRVDIKKLTNCNVRVRTKKRKLTDCKLRTKPNKINLQSINFKMKS